MIRFLTLSAVILIANLSHANLSDNAGVSKNPHSTKKAVQFDRAVLIEDNRAVCIVNIHAYDELLPQKLQSRGAKISAEENQSELPSCNSQQTQKIFEVSRLVDNQNKVAGLPLVPIAACASAAVIGGYAYYNHDPKDNPFETYFITTFVNSVVLTAGLPVAGMWAVGGAYGFGQMLAGAAVLCGGVGVGVVYLVRKIVD